MQLFLSDVVTRWSADHRRIFFAVLLALVVVCYLPFVDKAFHIDDPSYILFSKQIGWNPLTVAADGPGGQPFGTTHPFLNYYCIKIVRTLAGESEIALHASYVLFFVIALVALYDVGRVLYGLTRGSAILLMLFFCSMPAFMVSSHSIMADVPMAAFLLLAFSCYGRAFSGESRGYYIAAGVALTLALLTSYQAVAFIPLILLQVLLKRRVSWPFAASVTLPVLILAGFLLGVYLIHDYLPIKIQIPQILKSTHSTNVAGSSQAAAIKAEAPAISGITDEIFSYGLKKKTVQGKIVAILALLGSSCMFILPAYFLIKGRGKLFLLAVPAIAAACYSLMFYLFAYPVLDTILLSVLCGSGLVVLGAASFEAWRRYHQDGLKAEALFLTAWITTVILYCIAVLPFASGRYLLPVFPPLLILLVSGLAGKFAAPRNRLLATLAVVLSIAFGLLSAYSDYSYAGTYRVFADEVKTFRQSEGNSFDVWYIGQWGMPYYMDKAGARLLSADSNEPRSGDYVVIPEMAKFWVPSVLMRMRLEAYAVRDYHSSLPLRLFNRRSNAGFYCHLWGVLPFSISREPDEEFAILKVR